jgi:hypothetical protein
MQLSTIFNKPSHYSDNKEENILETIVSRPLFLVIGVIITMIVVMNILFILT